MTRVRTVAPVRVLDAGGWTDTAWAGHGLVCHLAMSDGASVVVGFDEDGADGVVLRVPSFGDTYAFARDAAPGRHPLLESAIRGWAPRGGSLDVTVSSAVPSGSGLGTSASVVVALVAALVAVCEEVMDPSTVAHAAHDIETGLGLQSGVQDQIAAAYGGANRVTIDAYPSFAVSPCSVATSTWDELERRVVTVYLGTPHRSSDVHDLVIGHVAGDGGWLLAPLRAAAARAADALCSGDLDAYGDAMIANTAAQEALHPALVSAAARSVFDVGRRCGAVGWKVNGAGGDGGTVTVISAEDAEPLVHALSRLDGMSLLPLRPAREGVRVVERD